MGAMTTRNTLRATLAAVRATGGAVRATAASLGARDAKVRASLRGRVRLRDQSADGGAGASTRRTAVPGEGHAERLGGGRTGSASRHDGRRFRNVEPGSQVSARVFAAVARSMVGRNGAGHPARPVPVEAPEFPSAAGDLAATWLGHATVLLEVDGYRVLADPMFSRRASPASFAGPSRLHPVPVTAAELPPLDAVLISHDHYDHLDRETVADLTRATGAPLLVPLGIGAHLRAWGVPEARIVELDWGGSHDIGTLRLMCTPARHFSGRGLTRDATLWSSWTVTGPSRRVFFGGDTGYTAAFADIGREQGPFDLTVLPIGAYSDAWPDIHLTPEQAVAAHRDLRGDVLLPIHWATFDLAPHPWAEPAERLRWAADGLTLALPPPGRRLTLPLETATAPWWA